MQGGAARARVVFSVAWKAIEEELNKRAESNKAAPAKKGKKASLVAAQVSSALPPLTVA